MEMMTTIRSVLIAGFLCITSVAASAQDSSVQDVLEFLATNQSVRTDDFVRDTQAAQATSDTLAAALLVELTTFPLPTSSGGFSYRFNPSLGTLERVAQSFGPTFVDRAVTAGAGYASASITFQPSQFVSLDGRRLGDGSLITTSNKFRDEAAPFDFESLTLDMRTDTVTLFGNYGVTDRIDVGFALPMILSRVSGERVNTYRGTSSVQARGQATAFGVGDIPIRSKQHLVRSQSWGLATSVELYLPTGSRENLQGTGKTALKTLVIASTAGSDIELSANGGFVFGGAANHAIMAGAVSAELTRGLTLSAEGVGRYVDGRGRISEVAQSHPLFSGVDTIRLLPTDSGIMNFTAVLGIRWNVAGTWLVNSYVLFPVAGASLAARPVPAFSVDYSFIP